MKGRGGGGGEEKLGAESAQGGVGGGCQTLLTNEWFVSFG